MNKTQQKLHDLMLSILPFKEFRQNDVVGIGKEDCKPRGIILYKHPIRNFRGKNIFEDYYCVLQTNDVETFCHISKLKFISRPFTLNDLLMAMSIRDCIYRTSKLYKELVLFRMYNKEKGHYEYFKFDLTLSLLNQEEETLKLIIGVLE